jgi:hypothetical protein
MILRDFNFLQSGENMNLSVIIMADRFFYALIDQNRRLVAHKSFPLVRYSDPDSTRMLLEDAFLKADYASIVVHVFNPWQVQLASRDAAMMEVLPSMQKKKISIHSLHGAPGGAAYYAMTSHQAILVDLLFSDKSVQITNVIQLFANYFKAETGKLLHVHIEENTVHLYMQHGDVFVFYNQFAVTGGNDILYFILAICQENKWIPDEVQMTMSGWIAPDNAMVILLQTYFPRLTTIRDDAFSLPAELDTSMEPSYYFAHFAGGSCV